MLRIDRTILSLYLGRVSLLSLTMLFEIQSCVTWREKTPLFRGDILTNRVKEEEGFARALEIFFEKVPSIPFSLAPRADYIRYKELPYPQLSNFPNFLLPRAWKRGEGKQKRRKERRGKFERIHCANLWNEFNEHRDREKYRYIYIYIFSPTVVKITRSKR